LIKGKYIFKSNGEIIAEKENVVTSNGIQMINKYLAQSTQDWAGTLLVGALYTVSASTDTTLAYEVSRSPITMKTYKPVSGSNQIVIKASLDPLLVASIYEIGIIPQNYFNTDAADNLYISEFDELYGSTASSDWSVGSSVATASNVATSGSSRFGYYNIAVPTASIATRSGFGLDVSGFNSNDFIQLLYYVAASSSVSPSLTFVMTDDLLNTWTSSSIRLSTSASGYYSASVRMLNDPTASFNYVIDRLTASFAGGNGTVYLDAVKFMDGSNKLSEQQLVSRSSSAGPLVTTKYGQPLEIEYYLTVT
jgi:hypothetical protein